MPQRTNKKISKTLLNSLAIISILAFISIVGTSFFNLTFLDWILPNLLLMVLGAGLIVEGQVRHWGKFRKGGFSSDELSHIVTGIVGIFSTIAGLLGAVGIQGSSLNSIRGFVASIAIVMIVIETWVVD